MKILGYSICLLCSLFLTQGCNKNDAYNQKIKSLDSLGGVLGSMVKELEKTDTITLQKAVNRYNYYNAFIQQNLNDTVAKNEADDLQHFYTSGKTLQGFSVNNKVILDRAHRVLNQLAQLSEDAKNKTVNHEGLFRYSEIEQEEAAKVLGIGNAHKTKLLLSMEEFKNSLPGVERLIKSRNNGELPVIIKDTVNL